VKLVQSSIIISELKRRPQRIVLGFGAIDNETRLSTYGYFYPEDTGILGAFFTYGVVGIGVFYLYFREVRLRRKQSLCHKDKTSLETFESLVYTLGVRVMHAFISGGFIFYPANTFLLLSIILKCVGSRDLNEESD